MTPRVLLILALTAFISLEALSTETKCNSCKIVLTDVKAYLPKLTEKIEQILNVAIKGRFGVVRKIEACSLLYLFSRMNEFEQSYDRLKNACRRYVTIPVFEEICEYIEQKLLHALFVWIEKKEGEIDPEIDCQYMRLCPRPKGFELLLKVLRVPDIPAV